MYKLLSLLLTLPLLASCGEQYNIAGNSSVPSLDGRMLYLRATPDGLLQATAQEKSSHCIDSCKVVHGRFSFIGDMDSVMMAMLFTGRECVMPVVIENGRLNVQVDNTAQRVSGGPLNDKLYKFFRQKNRLDNEMWELQQKSIRMLRCGKSPEEIDRKVGRRVRELSARSEALETNFVMENYDNVLGPGFFMMMCSQYPTPIMTEQISRIVQDAPACFMRDPFVHSYVRQARERAALLPPPAPRPVCADADCDTKHAHAKKAKAEKGGE